MTATIGRTTYLGRPASEWDALETACLDYLIELAGLGRTTTFDQVNEALAARTGLPGFDLGDPLGRSSLSALLVRVAETATSMYEGLGSLLLTCLVGYTAGYGADPGRCRQVAAVHRYFAWV